MPASHTDPNHQRHPQRNLHRLRDHLHAEARGPLPTAVRRLPTRVAVQPRKMGQVDAEKLDVRPFQRRAEDLHRAAVCTDRNG